MRETVIDRYLERWFDSLENSINKIFLGKLKRRYPEWPETKTVKDILFTSFGPICINIKYVYSDGVRIRAAKMHFIPKGRVSAPRTWDQMNENLGVDIESLEKFRDFLSDNMADDDPIKKIVGETNEIFAKFLIKRLGFSLVGREESKSGYVSYEVECKDMDDFFSKLEELIKKRKKIEKRLVRGKNIS
jgi:hypothetical protein